MKASDACARLLRHRTQPPPTWSVTVPMSSCLMLIPLSVWVTDISLQRTWRLLFRACVRNALGLINKGGGRGLRGRHGGRRRARVRSSC